MDKQKFQEELKKSMLAKEELRTSVLRLLLSAINYYEIQKGGAGYEATPEDVLQAIQSQVKQRRDSIEEYKKAGRQELADKEQKELEILQSFLPEQMSESDIQKVVDEIIAEVKPTGMQDMGKIMGALGPKLKGKADMNLVSNLVRQRLPS
ncbi:MAG: hypothetical protein A2152_01180 [Candidatus Levybacteria bacterium RBG_16_35_6]|nr:MAG: hypothetical protein US02_C0023G0009 [Candidatus Levybacteria bacterium GW2011_GWA2_36_13]KKP99160.1 MAG: hypothetical protein US07_C0023G0008 [Candidatus Levybacteria bacterium GW2011_GWB1_36_18]KKQ57969.1 MAG: hypothetical protein US77_C0013G0014 [Microgenomates group bacterium GW2011_GWC1_38_14]OGH10134.1 MAG: hypothetical protein A2152_01180 [Candidatus Levybacteria bacterium RBG_16_35_6]OGH43822.1 MAG: hypothetical protein A3I49_02725 [Candidatus Levybacteria bacterium RIFCSPLOWO2_